ncbi:MAG: phosphate ABC transporter substrate-binding protein PstS [Bacteroidaceae bacterium]|nr:phosphate ABC transporter substrate-binding protein PstS [Bacteroidaceae bacterium]
MKKTMKTMAACLMAALVLTSCGSKKENTENTTHEPVELSGSGASFPQPFYGVVFEQYGMASGNEVAYGAIGSGAGLRNLKDKVVDFAGSDAFLTDEELKDYEPVVHIPTCLGAIVLAYNIEGIDNLTLDGPTTADIFRGKIKKWNDPALAALNPDVALPDMDITPVYRSDGSGSTSVFTAYLNEVSADWKSEIGAGKTVNFPAGMAAKGNAGVAQVVAATKGSVGYIGSEYAFAQNIHCAAMINANGEKVAADEQSISAAASGDFPADTRVMIVNSKASGAFPIACLTWLVAYQEQAYDHRTEAQARGLVDLLQYILSDEAQEITTKVYYAPLPEKAREIARQNLKNIQYEGKSLLQ